MEAIVYQEVVLKLPKETAEAFEALSGLIAEVIQTSKEGWGIEDIPAVLGEGLVLATELADYDLIRKEYEADPVACINTLSFYITKSVEGILKAK